MRILVVDDKQEHLQAATSQLGSTHQVETRDEYTEAVALLTEDAPFDVLLSDLLMPAEPQTLGKEGLRFLGHEIPIGLVLAFRAAAVGVKHVAVITDANHHNHPMSAAIDWINPAYWRDEKNRVFQVNESRVLVAHAPLTEDGCKDWAKALAVVLDGAMNNPPLVDPI